MFFSIAVAGVFAAGMLLGAAEQQLPPVLEAGFLASAGPEQPSPKDRVSEGQIAVYKDYVLLEIADAEWAIFSDTNSMDPVLDEAASAIEIVPSSPAEIQEGDIVSYESAVANAIVVHRVVEIGSDSDGWYARMKGDNNSSPDPEKVRFHQIRRVVIAIIY